MPAPRPRSLKVIAGTVQPCRDKPDEGPRLPVIDEAPPPPDWLPNAHAVNEWNRLAPILTAHRLLTEAGTGSLAVLCALYGKIQQLFAAGESPTANMIGQYRALANDFGLTPIAQGKVRPAAEADAKGNRFAKFGKRPA